MSQECNYLYTGMYIRSVLIFDNEIVGIRIERNRKFYDIDIDTFITVAPPYKRCRILEELKSGYIQKSNTFLTFCNMVENENELTTQEEINGQVKVFNIDKATMISLTKILLLMQF